MMNRFDDDLLPQNSNIIQPQSRQQIRAPQSNQADDGRGGRIIEDGNNDFESSGNLSESALDEINGSLS